MPIPMQGGLGDPRSMWLLGLAKNMLAQGGVANPSPEQILQYVNTLQMNPRLTGLPAAPELVGGPGAQGGPAPRPGAAPITRQPLGPPPPAGVPGASPSVPAPPLPPWRGAPGAGEPRFPEFQQPPPAPNYGAPAPLAPFQAPPPAVLNQANPPGAMDSFPGTRPLNWQVPAAHGELVRAAAAPDAMAPTGEPEPRRPLPPRLQDLFGAASGSGPRIASAEPLTAPYYVYPDRGQNAPAAPSQTPQAGPASQAPQAPPQGTPVSANQSPQAPGIPAPTTHAELIAIINDPGIPITLRSMILDQFFAARRNSPEGLGQFDALTNPSVPSGLPVQFPLAGGRPVDLPPGLVPPGYRPPPEGRR